MTALDHSRSRPAATGRSPDEEDRIVSDALTILESRFRGVATRKEMDCNEAAKYLQLRIGGLPHEVFAVMFLDGNARLIACEEMFRGTLDHTSAYPREVARRVLELNAAGVVLSHNHPSGDPTPSRQDVALTKTMVDALALIDCTVVDHIIVANDKACSLSDNHLL